VLRDVAMATIFWLSVGYNFGCVIAIDKLFDSRGWVFGVKLSDEDIAEIQCLRVVAIVTNFETKIAITECVNDRPSDSAIGYGGGFSDRPTDCIYRARQ